MADNDELKDKPDGKSTGAEQPHAAGQSGSSDAGAGRQEAPNADEVSKKEAPDKLNPLNPPACGANYPHS